jgi:predicted enzyme related to lactoylglutathione lyase
MTAWLSLPGISRSAISSSKGVQANGNTFGTDILIQAPDPKQAALFYVEQLAFEITGEEPNMISVKGKNINLFIERGPALGPVLEVTVDDAEEAKRRLVKSGCEIVKDEPDFPRCYVKDPYGLIYNLIAQ